MPIPSVISLEVEGAQIRCVVGSDGAGEPTLAYANTGLPLTPKLQTNILHLPRRDRCTCISAIGLFNARATRPPSGDFA